MGVCDWTSAYAIWLDKVMGTKPLEDNAKLRAGRVLQDAIATLTTMELGGGAYRYEVLCRSLEHPYATCTPDFLFDHPELGRVLLETKNTTQAEEWPLHGNPCLRNWVQCQHQMLVMGERVMVLAGLLFGYELRTYVVHRDDRFLERRLIPELRRLWGMIGERVRPDPDHTEASRRALEEEYETITPGKVIELGLEYQAIDDELADHEPVYKRAKQERDRLRNLIRDAMGDAERAVLPDGTRWTRSQDVTGKRSLRRWPMKGARA